MNRITELHASGIFRLGLPVSPIHVNLLVGVVRPLRRESANMQRVAEDSNYKTKRQNRDGVEDGE
jgi:hypothetical protein